MPIDFNDHARWLAVRDAVYAHAFVAGLDLEPRKILEVAEEEARLAVLAFEQVHPEPITIASVVTEPDSDDRADEPFVDVYRRWINAGEGDLASGKICEAVAENGIAPRCHVREIAGGYEFRFQPTSNGRTVHHKDVVFCAYTSGKATTGGPECSARADVRTLLASLGFEVKS